MACFLSKRSVTGVTLKDGAGTPETLSLVYWTDITIQAGAHAETDLMDEYGDFISDTGPLKGDAGMTTVTLNNMKLRSVGAGASIALVDIINQTGEYANWTSTTDTGGTSETTVKTFNLEIALVQDGTPEVWYFHRVTIAPGSVAFSAEGAVTSITFNCRQPYPLTTAES